MEVLPDGDVQIATTTTQKAADELNAMAKARGITRAALLRDFIGRGMRDFGFEQRILQEMKSAGIPLTVAEVVRRLGGDAPPTDDGAETDAA